MRDAEEPRPKEETSPLDAVWQFLWRLRRRWLIVVIAVIASAAASVLAVSRMTPYYSARATIVIHASAPQVLDDVRGVNEEELWTPTAYAEYSGTQREILKSRRVSELALKRLELDEDPTFLGVAELPEAEQKEAIKAADPIARLQSLVKVGNVPDSRVVWVAVEYPDPEMAARLVNAVTASYLEVVTSKRETTGEEAKTQLETEKKAAKDRLRDKEKELDDFKQDNGITTISLADRQNITTQNILILTRESKEAEARRIAAAAVHDEAKRLAKADNNAIGALVPKAERIDFDERLEALSTARKDFADTELRYGPKMPEYKQVKSRLSRAEKDVEDARKSLLDSLAARRRAAKTTESKLIGAVDRENTRALSLGRLEPEYRELEREAVSAEEEYQRLTRRDAEIGVTNRIEAEAPVEILDDATVPRAPVRPRKLIILVASCFAGLLLGTALAIAADVRDQRIRSVGDLNRALSPTGVPILGQLPLLPLDPALGASNIREQTRHRDLFVHLHPQSKVAERCRGIRTALGFTLPGSASRVLLVTSPSPGEGKSAIAINMALSFCQAGKRVLLVDADMRRPRVHRAFPPGVDANGGLSDVLEGHASFDESVQRSIDGVPENLHVLTCNRLPGTPAELLESPTMMRLVASVRESYDMVLIDSPPVLAVTDPLILGPLVDGVILVARCRSTDRAHLGRTIHLLKQGSTNLLGVVLNDVDAKAERGDEYGYSYGYGGAYYTYGQRDPSVDATS